MKKRLTCLGLVIVLIVTMCVPASATNTASNVSTTYPRTPKGYTYYTSNRGNADVDARLSHGLWDITLIAVGLTGIGAAIAAGVAGFVVNQATMNDNPVITGKYLDEVYKCDNPGIYPYIYWHRITYTVTIDGVDEVRYTSEYEYALLPRSLEV